MFSRKQDPSSDPQDEGLTGGQGTLDEAVEVITGEDVSLDAKDGSDATELVGTVEAIDIDTLPPFDETVSLPTGPSLPTTPADVAVESETISQVAADTYEVQDVLAHRDLPSTMSAAASRQTLAEAEASATEDTQVLRRSLLGTGEEVADVDATTVTTSAGPGGQTEVTAVDTQTVIAEPPRATFSSPQGIAPHGDQVLDSALLAGATVLPSVSSKAPARWLSLILSIIFVPIAWYLLSDASARLTLAEGNPMTSGNVNFAALIELFAGVVFVALIGVLSAYSSLGLWITGGLVFLLGLPFLVMPAWSNEFLDNYFEGVRNFNDFGANVVAHLVLTGFTGVLVMTGLTMVIFAWVITAVRRAGRREESMRAMVAQVNPEGLQAHWAKKATERDRRGQ